MEAINALKRSCIAREFKSFKNLAIGEYLVDSFQRVSTNFGERIRIEISDYYMYLPQRQSNALTDEFIEKLNASTVIMAFKGRDPEFRNRLLLDFDTIEVDGSGELVSTSITPQSQCSGRGGDGAGPSGI